MELNLTVLLVLLMLPTRIVNIFPSIPLHVKNTQKSSQSLKDSLMEINLAVPPVLLMAQQGNCMVY